MSGTSTPATDLSALWANPGWHLYQLDLAAGNTEWLQLTEGQFHNASFMDQRLLSASPAPVSVPLQALADLIGDGPSDPAAAATPHWIFHIGHCGSTLLSRALAASRDILPLREPLTLRQLANAMDREADWAADQLASGDSQWQTGLRLALAAHRRSFRASQRSMIKATSTCNALIRPIAREIPDARMLLLLVRLEHFLAGMLGKQEPARDLAGHAPLRLQEWQALTGQSFTPPAVDLSEVRLAVLTWLTAVARLLQAAEEFPDQCLLLDFDAFLNAPEAGIDSLLEHFSLEDSGAEIRSAWPDISLSYSKQPDQAYSAFNRNRTLSRGRILRAAEIRAGLDWAQQLMQQHAVFQDCSRYL